MKRWRVWLDGDRRDRGHVHLVDAAGEVHVDAPSHRPDARLLLGRRAGPACDGDAKGLAHDLPAGLRVHVPTICELRREHVVSPRRQSGLVAIDVVLEQADHLTRREIGSGRQHRGRERDPLPLECACSRIGSVEARRPGFHRDLGAGWLRRARTALCERTLHPEGMGGDESERNHPRGACESSEHRRMLL
jgi:hypothetical protein